MFPYTSLELDIGFLMPTYEVNEAAGMAVVQFGLLGGTLEGDIDVDFTFSSGTATGSRVSDVYHSYT